MATPKKPTVTDKIILSEIKKYPVIFNVKSFQARAWDQIANESGKTVKQCQNVWKKFGDGFLLYDEITLTSPSQVLPLTQDTVDTNELTTQMEQLEVKPLVEELESLVTNLPPEVRIKLLKHFKAIAQVEIAEIAKIEE